MRGGRSEEGVKVSDGGKELYTYVVFLNLDPELCPPTGSLCEEQYRPLSCQGGDRDVCQTEVASALLTIL